MSYKRAKAMEDTAKSQADAVLKTEQGQRQDRLKNAIEHLGHESDSVRLGAVPTNSSIWRKTPKSLRQTVLDILCAHIRSNDERNRISGNAQVETLGGNPKPIDVVVRTGTQDFQRLPYQLARKLAEWRQSRRSASGKCRPDRCTSARG